MSKPFIINSYKSILKYLLVFYFTSHKTFETMKYSQEMFIP